MQGTVITAFSCVRNSVGGSMNQSCAMVMDCVPSRQLNAFASMAMKERTVKSAAKDFSMSEVTAVALQLKLS